MEGWECRETTYLTGEGVNLNIFPFRRRSQLASVQSNREANIVYPSEACSVEKDMTTDQSC